MCCHCGRKLDEVEVTQINSTWRSRVQNLNLKPSCCVMAVPTTVLWNAKLNLIGLLAKMIITPQMYIELTVDKEQGTQERNMHFNMEHG